MAYQEHTTTQESETLTHAERQADAHTLRVVFPTLEPIWEKQIDLFEMDLFATSGEWQELFNLLGRVS